jgi:antagonist of KipI
MIEVVTAPPFLTIQDLGRPGRRADGVPPSGAMDPELLTLANLLAGNVAGASGLEWALGTGVLRFHAEAAVAAAGAVIAINGLELPEWTAAPVNPGDHVTLNLPAGRFAWLAVAGGIDVPEVIGSRSTYLPGKFGGLEGRRLRSGDRLPLGAAVAVLDAPRTLPDDLLPGDAGPIRLVPGPQAELFGPEAWSALLSGQYAIAPASDRMGYRLTGPALSHSAAAGLPSEPVCPGAVQVPAGGAPIVLMADGPTVGGYPKIAAVISTDLGRFSRLTPGSRPHFALVTFEEAVAALRERAARLRDAARLFLAPVSPPPSQLI